MAALDFPNSPTGGQTYTGPGGAVWQFDGAKWINGASAATVVSSFNTRTGAVTLASGDVTTALTYTPYNATNPSGYQTAAQVAAVLPQPNYCDNSGFSVNQRGYVSATALAAGIYGFDRWKAGAGGATLTFTASPPSTVVTITAGTLQQVVEGASVAGGNYMLSWTGTAQGRIGAGAYTASPVAVTGITAGANTTIEFNVGTLSRVKLESGTVVTPWAAASARYDLANCERFYCLVPVLALATAAGANNYLSVTGFYGQKMRATPTTTSVTTMTADVNLAAFVIDLGTDKSFRAYGYSSAASTMSFARVIACSADL